MMPDSVSYQFDAINIESYTLGQLDTNCYIVWTDSDNHGFVIDPADEGDFISQRLLELGIILDGIILTHGHFDHVLGLLALKLNFSVPIYMNSNDAFLLRQGAASAQHWLHLTVDPIPPADEQLDSQTKLQLGSEQFTILLTPGHTPGSVSLYLAGHNTHPPILFSGDCLFKQAIGRTDFSYSDQSQMVQSLHTLSTLPSDTLIFSGHGDSTTLSLELPNIHSQTIKLK